MTLQYLRIAVFYKLLDPFSKQSRAGRMRLFTTLMGVTDGMSILDLGGQPMIWDTVSLDIRLAILNRPGVALRNTITQHDITYVEGDACNVAEFDSRSFDIAFSNSVIEHLGSVRNRAKFAKEVRRLGRSYWVQTPARWFPIEAHCGMPFWWFYPKRVRRYFIERWRKKLPAWTSMVEETTVLSKAELQELFPEARIYTETVFGIPKAYVAYLARAESSGPNTNRRDFRCPSALSSREAESAAGLNTRWESTTASGSIDRP